MKRRNLRKEKPELETLDDRVLLTAGLTASFSRGVLSVVGTSTDSAIVVDVLATRTHRGVSGVVAVEGAGTFRAAQVKQVVITSVAGETVDVNTAARWNPRFRYNVLTPANPTPSPSPSPTPTPSPSPPVVSAPSQPTPSPVSAPISASGTMSAEEQSIVDAVNQVRAQNGLAPLKVDTQLVEMAHIEANNMVAFNTMAHTIPGAAQPGLADRASFVGYNYSLLGENIAFNYSSVADVMNGWMNSPEHRANILGNYTEMGVGIALDASGQPYYCQVFGTPMT